MCGISPDNFVAHITLSIVVAAICGGAGFLCLRWATSSSGISLFGPAIDPDRKLQRIYGVLSLCAAAATLICPFLPHASLPLVHETIGWVCVAAIVLLVPRLFYALVMRELSATGTT